MNNNKSFPHAESMPSLAALDEDSDSLRSSTSGSRSPVPQTLTPHVESCVGLSDMCSDTSLDDDSTNSARKALAIAPHLGFKKVLVTGGAGFVGSSTAAHLLERGDAVVIVDEMNDYYDVRIKENNLRRLRELCPDKQRLTIYKGDICDEEFMLQLFEKERPQWVCHMAARAGVRPSIQDPYVYIHR